MDSVRVIMASLIPLHTRDVTFVWKIDLVPHVPYVLTVAHMARVIKGSIIMGYVHVLMDGPILH